MMLAGVDGCPAGWIVVVAGAGFSDPQVLVLPRVEALFEEQTLPAVVAIDMPIGLPARVGPGGRGPEGALRPHLGARQSSVFSVPARAAVYAADYAAACAAALATSDPPRKVSKQCFHLFPRIREVDGLLRSRPELRDRVFESHPEGVFMRLNGGCPLVEPKKVKSRPHGAGLEERRALLVAAGLPPALVEATPPRGAGADDLLDACACLVTAGRLKDGVAVSFPDVPGRDEHGLAIAIWA